MYSVLVADDHAIVRSGISYLVDLQPNFKVVGGTASGTDTYMRVEQGGVDILIMDLSMPPGENGLITTKRIHDKFPHVRIIILSMHEEQEYINKAMANGAMSYILKSSPDSEILTALQHVANKEKYLDKNIIVSKADIKKINESGNSLNLEGYSTLSKREKEVFPLIALGYSNKEISQKMFISTKTVEAHKANISRKLHLHGRVELVQYAIHHHLIDF
ncbi:response regulator transcription factor [Limosilactobacillus sp. STM2_1]|uniref:Response regulator transcription factor n=1 Tax=Limosilactobacillus rudii TaxID=2759755 RepID=A0A7W3UMD0_9LACO|nr:response regulator transcription factor [Limosilactobacillus rudii]MBB1078892.1 response regulator transcription factor [Limosilactobacillus rudii]MBB1098232.1 response regulator transcription factor [Limosilactobacillus rudii]MCD7135653.1 response regulator transcription factor [Limosilactobacillus rudii]